MIHQRFIVVLELLWNRDSGVLATLAFTANQHRDNETDETNDNGGEETDDDVAVPD